MTREEAIECVSERVSIGGTGEQNCMVVFGVNTDTLDEAFDMAISAIRQQERERNEPLTMDELREMDKEPVWWWNKSAKPVCTICVWDRFMNEPMFANYDWQSEDTLKLSKYKWLKKCGYKPYRQKPEEDKHEPN